MFWTFGNPIRHIRRISGRAEYTRLPSSSSSRRPSSQDAEKGDSEIDGVVENLENRRRKVVKTLVVLLLLGIGGAALKHQRRISAQDEGVSSSREPASDALELLAGSNATGLGLDADSDAMDDFEDQVPTPLETGDAYSTDVSLIREVIYDIDDPTHVYLAPMATLPKSRPFLSSTPASEAALSFIETGGVSVSHLAFAEPATVDIVYLWVNSTDSVFPEAYAERMEAEGLPVDRGQARRWRDNGELRGAVRSSTASLGTGLRKVHIVSADYPYRPDDMLAEEEAEKEGDDVESIDWRGTVGQIPEWLDWQAQEDGTSDKVTWHFHSDIFRLPRHDDGSLAADESALGGYELVSHDDVTSGTVGEMSQQGDDEDVRLEEAWRELVLPSFNSFAIESRVGWITGLSQNFILSNDDMFFLKPMSIADFHHPLLGPILRLATQLTVKPHITPDLYSSHGEWGGLQYASELLSRRFTLRSQPYPEHFPKSLTLEMMDEASIMFANELGEAATRGFRESKRGLADIEMAALATWLRVERWREALLWSWVVAKVGIWNEQAREEVEGLFGPALSEGKNVVFRKGARRTLTDVADAEAALDTRPLNTKIKFSSLDGHLPIHLDRPAQQCFFAPYCLPNDFFSDRTKVYPSDEIFKMLAFERPQCGDCLIDALITKSGERGLSAFIPDEDATHTSQHQQPPPPDWKELGPHLPLTNDWTQTDFSLDTVIQGTEVNLRQFCLGLLSRYIYAIGETPAIFAPVASARQLSSRLRQVQIKDNTAMVCINDDVRDGDQVGSEAFRNVLEEWMEEQWPNAGSWERSVGLTADIG